MQASLMLADAAAAAGPQLILTVTFDPLGLSALWLPRLKPIPAAMSPWPVARPILLMRGFSLAGIGKLWTFRKRLRPGCSSSRDSHLCILDVCLLNINLSNQFSFIYVLCNHNNHQNPFSKSFKSANFKNSLAIRSLAKPLWKSYLPSKLSGKFSNLF